MSIRHWVAGGALMVALPSALMESHQEGSSVPYRSSVITGAGAATESISLVGTDLLTQVGPVTRTLAEQLQQGLGSVATATGGAAVTPPAATATTLPSAPQPQIMLGGGQ